jgi:hypothetical protein
MRPPVIEMTKLVRNAAATGASGSDMANRYAGPTLSRDLRDNGVVLLPMSQFFSTEEANPDPHGSQVASEVS